MWKFVIVLVFLYCAGSAEANSISPAPVYGYRVINTYPHDPEAFTQGLFFEDGLLYEGTGLKGRSTLRKVKLDTGAVLMRHDLPYEFFGEGITAHEDRVIQLTWRSHAGFVYDRKSFKLLSTFFYVTEGWGITNDGRHLIMSDGTANLYFLDPETFQEIRRIGVHDGTSPVTRLNELEYIKGEIFANIWLWDKVARIDPKSGRVKGWIDLKGLSPFKDQDRTTKVLNGIAYDKKNDRLFVTGKLWPYIYEITLINIE